MNNIIFHIPHASRKVPDEQRPFIVLDDERLSAELLAMTDAYTDKLFSAHSKAGDSIVQFPISRLVVDPERFLDDDGEIMSKVGMGVVYWKTSKGELLRNPPSMEQKRRLLQDYYFPHHERLTAATKNDLAEHGSALIMDCHSFPSSPLPFELDQDKDRPDFCVGTDPYHTQENLIEALEAAILLHGFSFSRNKPLSGSLVPLEYYHKDQRVISVMIEVNRRLYMEESTGRKSGNYEDLKDFLGTLVEVTRQIVY